MVVLNSIQVMLWIKVHNIYVQHDTLDLFKFLKLFDLKFSLGRFFLLSNIL